MKLNISTMLSYEDYFTNCIFIMYVPAKMTSHCLVESISRDPRDVNADNATMRHGDPHHGGLLRCFCNFRWVKPSLFVLKSAWLLPSYNIL